MYSISVYNSEYLHGRNQDFVQMCRYLVLYDSLLLCYICCCIIILVVLLAVVVIVLGSPKRNLYLNTHCVSVKSVPHNLNISYRRHVCNSRTNNRVSYKKYIGIVTMSLSTTVYAVQQLPSVNTQLQSCHVNV